MPNRKTSLKVTIEVVYSRFNDHVPEPEIVQLSSAPVTKSRQTSTSKGLEIHAARVEERVAAGVTEPDSILKRWKCRELSCNNGPRWCYIESVDGVGRHKEISTGLLPAWVASIRLGESTVERPSEKIISQMIPVKSKKKLTPAEQVKDLLMTMKEVSTPAAPTLLTPAAPVVLPVYEASMKRGRQKYLDDDEYRRKPRKRHVYER